MGHYSKELKEEMVRKLCQPNGPSAYHLSKETGISVGSLYKWRDKAGGVTKMTKIKRPEDWNPEERLEAVFGAQGLSEQEFGEFLRSKGLHSNHIEEWKADVISTVVAAKKSAGRPKKDPELAASQKENKLLKKDLNRKNRALAEQTALVILQKKVQEIWGDEEDDE